MSQQAIQLNDSRGRKIGMLDLSTGTIFDDSGKRINQYEARDDERQVALSDYAATIYYEHVSNLTRQPVNVTFGDGNERLIMGALVPTDVHIASGLVNYAAGYHNKGAVADLYSPVVLTPKASDYFWTWDSKDAFQRAEPSTGAEGAAVSEISPRLSNTLFGTTGRALASFVSTETQSNADAPLRPFQAAVNRVMNALLLEREIRVATLATTTSNFDASLVTALTSSTKWSTGASSDPVANLHQILENSYHEPTGIIMPRKVRNAFARNPNVQKYFAFKGTPARGLPTDQELSAILELPPIHTANMRYLSGGALTFAWGTSCVLFGQPPTNPPVDQTDVSTSYSFRWMGGDTPDGTVSGGFLVRMFFDPKRGPRGGNVVVVVHNDAEVQTSKLVGGLITGTV